MSFHFHDLVWRGCNNKLQVCLILHRLMAQLAYPSMENDLCACTIGLSTTRLYCQPEKMVKVGESYQVPSGAVHDARSGPQGTKVIATYVVEKGKPLASPTP